MKTLIKYWQIFWKFRYIQLISMMEYRLDTIFWSVISIMWTIFNFFFFDLIVNVTGSIGGWSRTEMYLLIGTFNILDAATWSFFYANMNLYTSSVHNGEFNIHLTRPIDTQFLVSVQDNSYNNIFRFLIGVYVVVHSVLALGRPISMLDIVLFCFLIATSMILIYSTWFIVATSVFWFEKIDNINEIIPNTRRLWQVPREIFTGIFSTVFTVLFPLGLVSSIPSEVLVGRSSLPWILYFVLFSLGAFCLSRWFFFFSLKRYSGIAN